MASPMPVVEPVTRITFPFRRLPASLGVWVTA